MAHRERRILAIDIGSGFTKTVVIDERVSILDSQLVPSGANLKLTAETAITRAVESMGCSRKEVVISATGLGRHKIDSDYTISEITAHAWGCIDCLPLPLTVVGIGCQDTEIIRLDSEGRRSGFEMNVTCASGTGAFLDELSRRLMISGEDFHEISRHTSRGCNCGGICTVYAMSEILNSFRQGVPVEQIIVGAYESIVDRILELGSLEERIVMSGGVVAMHPRIAEILAQKTGLPVVIAPSSQLRGAIGAARYALQNEQSRG